MLKHLICFIILSFNLNVCLYPQIPGHGNFKIDSYKDRIYLFVKGDKLIWKDTGSWLLNYSNDGGKTIVNSYNFHSLNHVRVMEAFLCSNGNIIMASDSMIYYSIDNGKSFKLSIDKSTNQPAKCLYWNNPKSIDEGNGVIIFGDYGPDGPHPGDGTMTKSLWRSTDSGITWENILTLTHDPTGKIPASIRHFHTCHYNKKEDAWLVTTGDYNIQVKWLISTDQGNNWYQVDSTQNQNYRTIALQIMDSNKIIWGTDNGLRTGGIFTLDWAKLFMPGRSLNQLSSSKGAEIYNLWEYNGQLMYADRVDSNAAFNPGVYYSSDRGNNWQKVLEWPRNDNNAAGFWQGCGVDDSGRVFMPLTSNMQGYPGIVGISYSFLRVQPVSPFNNSIKKIQPLQLTWMSFNNVENYRLQFGTDSTLSTTIVDATGITDTTYNISDLADLTTYYWRITTTNEAGVTFSSPVWKFSVKSDPSAIIYRSASYDYELHQNYPNPFNPVTTINFSLPKMCKVTIKIFEIMGREVAILENGSRNAGKYSVQFDGSKFTSGVYIYSMRAGNYYARRKMILLK